MNQMNQMTQMFGQMMMWPMAMFADMVSRSMQGMQGMQGMSGMSCSGGSTCPSDDKYLSCPPKQLEGSSSTSSQSSGSDWSCRDRCDDDWSCNDKGDENWSCGSGKSGSCGCGCNNCRNGNCRSSCHCGSDKVWLVEYSIINLGRGRDSYDVPCRQRLVRECMSCEEFKNWVIADYVREHPYVNGKNLRVYVKVLDCWCKEDWDYEEEQIQVLKQIRNALRREDREEERDQGEARDYDRDREPGRDRERERDRDSQRDAY